LNYDVKGGSEDDILPLISEMAVEQAIS